MILSLYVKVFPAPESPRHFLLFSCRTGAVVRVGSALLDAARSGTLSLFSAEPLARHGFLADDPEAERREMLGWFDRINARRRRCSAVVVLTRACNLACPYCFEAEQPGRRQMDGETADRFVAFVTDEHLARGRAVHLNFYGGEALLRPDLIRRIAGPLREAGDNRFSFSLVTNGTLLTGEMVREFILLGLRGAKVTLDGPPEVHDRYRPFASGEGSFATIVANLREVSGLIDIAIGGNYTRGNWREFPRLLDLLPAEGLTPERVRLVRFDPVIGRDGAGGLPDFPEGCGGMGEPWLVEASLFLREEIMKRGYRTSKPAPAACMVEFDSDLVVDTDGAFYRCPAFIGRPEFVAGSVQSGFDGAAGERYGMDVWKKDECLDCSYLPLCFGGCRYLKLIKDGAVDGVACQREYLDATLEAMVRSTPAAGPARRSPAPLPPGP